MDTTKARSRLFTLFLAALTILFLIVVQARHFHGRPYRQDEAWVVHFALTNIDQVGFFPHIFRPLGTLLPENFLQDIWVHLFGHHEHIVRYFSTLLTALTLAMFYRLASALFDRHTGWLALLLLGTLGIFTFHSHEARPYALLILGAVSFPWALLLFIERPDLQRGAFAALCATVPFYAHPFILFVIAAQLICVIVFVRWDRELYRRGVVLFAVLALLIGYRTYINYVDRAGVIAYNVESSWDGLLILYDWFRSNPESLGLLLLLGGILTVPIKLLSGRFSLFSVPAPAEAPAGSWLDYRMRFPAFWRESWLVLSALVILALPMLVNAFMTSLTPRNLLILAPSLALTAVIALRRMPRYLQLLVLLFFCLPFVTEFRYLVGNAGYWEIAAYLEERYQPGRDRLLVVAGQLWETVPINYFLRERATLGLTEQDVFTLSGQPFANDKFVEPMFDADFTATGYGDDDWQRTRDYLGENERLWLVKATPYQGGQNMLDALESEFTLYSAIDFPGETYYFPLEVLEYRRHPPAAAPLWRFGADINLQNWRLNQDHQVQPCAQVSVDTWWSTEVALDQLYSSTLVIAGPDGNGIANADDMPGGVYLTSLWQPDRLYFDERILTIPCDIAEGDYPLLLGMYELPREGEPLKILPIRTSAGQPTGRRYEYLTTLLVRR